MVFLFGASDFYDWFNSYFEEYTKENDKGILVKTEFQKEATQILQARVAAGDTPDLMSVGLPQPMVDKGDFYDMSGEAWWSTLMPSAKELSVDIKSGKNYYVPMCMSAVGLFYNKAIFQELGLTPAKTWDEFVKNLTVIKEKKPDVVPFYMGGKDAWMLAHLWEYNVDGVPKQLLGYSGFEKAASQNDLKALGWDDSSDGVVAKYAKCLMELKEKGLINSNVVTATEDNQISAFVFGKAAMIGNGIWELASMNSKNPDFKDIGFSTYPTFMDGVKNMVGSPLDGQVAISSSSKDLDSAKKIVELMLEPDAMKSLCEKRGAIPINPNVDANWSVIKDDVRDVLKNSVGATWTQNLPGSFNDDERGRLIQELFVGKYATPEAFAAEYVSRWTKAYDDAKAK